MDPTAFTSEKPAFDFGEKAAQVLPNTEPTLPGAFSKSDDAIPSDLLPGQTPQQPSTNGDPTAAASEHYLGLHPALSNGNSPAPAPAVQPQSTPLPSMADFAPKQPAAPLASAAIEQPVEHVAQGIQPTAPFVPEDMDLAADAAPPVPALTTTSVPPPVEQPTSDVRDEPAAAPPPLGSGIPEMEREVAPPETASASVAPVSTDASRGTEPQVSQPAGPMDISQLVSTEAPPLPSAEIAPAPAQDSAPAPLPEPVSEPVPEPLQASVSAGPIPSSLVAPEPEAPISDPAPAPVPATETALFDEAVAAPSAPDIAPALPVDASVPQQEAVNNQDTEMTDATIAVESTNGVVRPRDEDDAEEPSAKRTKLETEPEPATEAATQLQTEADFKKPELPPLSTEASAVVEPSNGAGETPITAVPVSATPLPEGFQSVDATPMSTEQKKYLVELMRRAKKTKDAIAFLNPVDPVALNIPTYPEIVKEPMDLSTIEAKLKDGRHGSADDMVHDLELMVNNSRIFNGPAHVVTLAGENLRSYFMKSIKTQLPRKGVAPPPKPIKTAVPPVTRPAQPRRESRTAVARSPTIGTPRSAGGATETYALQPDGTPLIRRDSTANDGRPKREIHRPQPKDLPYQSARPKKKKHLIELKFCQHVMKELMSKQHQQIAFPFYDPVDPVALNIPHYHNVIKKPMDLGTIQSNLKNGLYSNGKEFKTDVELIFANCYKFNPPTDGVYQMGKELEELFKGLWEGRDEWIKEHAPTPEARSEDEDEDEDDEEDDEDDEPAGPAFDTSRLAQLQEQMAALHAEMSNLVANANAPLRKSPTAKAGGGAGGKKSKKGGADAAGGAGAKKTKRSGSNAAAAASGKPAKAKKDKKVPKLTQEQKREVSEGIGQLDDAGMRKAVQIIRNGVPSLQNVNDDELELDIDEIPEAVVYDLYRFVRSLRPKTSSGGGAAASAADEALFDEPADDDYEPPSRARGSTAGGAGPGRKKNKPMTAAAQESKIAEIEQRLKAFEGGGGSAALAGGSIAVGGAAAAGMASGSRTPDDEDDEDEDADGSSSEEE